MYRSFKADVRELLEKSTLENSLLTCEEGMKQGSALVLRSLRMQVLFVGPSSTLHQIVRGKFFINVRESSATAYVPCLGSSL